ncbi:MAG TPA: metallophosphoesterase [Bryobacteraceae bacterium]|nr:metallophosphoesterase [Bryobacteraceae bacterium]
MADYIKENIEKDGIDRRGFLNCMAWAGTGVLYSLTGGVARSQMLGHGKHANGAPDLNFVQISDSHIGFNKDANKDVVGTLKEAVDKINALHEAPAFLIHTGDISHLSKPEEFDTVDSILKTVKVGKAFYVPGEHDVLGDDGKGYLARYGKETQGNGWFSFDMKGVHFVGLVNVMNLKAGGLGSLGNDQLEWLEKDLKGRSSSTPIVVFAHVPLWTVYQDWGWGTDDGAQALTYMKRFGSVSILNGHIHQNIQKVEGNMTFHTATSTAFPQPKPGSAPSPGPMKVPTEQLRSLLGLTEVSYVRGRQSLAIVDTPLAESSDKTEVKIDNFAFTPSIVKVRAGAEVTWINHDDIPHNVISTTKAFASPVLDTDEKFTHIFTTAGEFPYYCSIHPKMTAKLVVEAA